MDRIYRLVDKETGKEYFFPTLEIANAWANTELFKVDIEDEDGVWECDAEPEELEMINDIPRPYEMYNLYLTIDTFSLPDKKAKAVVLGASILKSLKHDDFNKETLMLGLVRSNRGYADTETTLRVRGQEGIYYKRFREHWEVAYEDLEYVIPKVAKLLVEKGVVEITHDEPILDEWHPEEKVRKNFMDRLRIELPPTVKISSVSRKRPRYEEDID